MNIELHRITIESFKGIKHFDFTPDGHNASLIGANGTGKTSVFDAFLWLLFGKDSTGRKQFDLRPLDGENMPIKGLTLSVECVLSVDGVIHTLTKNHTEKVVKKQIRGFETACYIDEVPKKAGEFEEWISSIISEDTFKLLTDLHYFSEKLHWQDRRKVLLSIIGEVGTPEGFENLNALLNGRTIEDCKKVLANQKKQYEKEQSEINPRIDELQRSLDSYAGGDTTDNQTRRDAAKAKIDALDKQRTALSASEQARSAKIDQVNRLKVERSQREIKLASLGLSSVHKEKAGIESALEERRNALRQARAALNAHNDELVSTQRTQTNKLELLNQIREHHARVTAKIIEDVPQTDLNCNTCGQKLPPEMIAAVEKNRKARVAIERQEKADKLASIANEGTKVHAECVALKQKIDALQTKKIELTEAINKSQTLVQEAEADRIDRFAVLAEIEKTNKVNPETDAEWVELGKQIAELEQQIGNPVSEQLRVIDTQRAAINDELAEINKALANADNAKKSALRIKELEQQEKDIAQKIADVERQLAEIDDYKSQQSAKIEAAVNGRFKHVNFKLFNTLLNGSIEDCCEAMLDGVPYADCSTGQKILIGVDIINVLSAHYGVSVPLVVDNAESLTYPLESTAQTIRLFAKEDVKKLKATVEKQTAAVA